MKTAFRLIASMLVLLVPAAVWKSKQDKALLLPTGTAVNATSMPVYPFWQPRYPMPAAKHTATTTSAEGVDTQHIKQSAWFSVISKNIEQDLYHFRAQPAGSSLLCENPGQQLTGSYAWDRMQLSSATRPTATLSGVKPFTNGGNWSLSIRLEDIAFNGTPYYHPLKNAVV